MEEKKPEKKHYLIKRNPDLTNKGVIVKRNVKKSGFSETTIKYKVPTSNKLERHDVIYVAETDYGIYAYGEVLEVDEIEYIESVDDAIRFFRNHKNIDASYWLKQIEKLQDAKEKDENSILKFQKYTINQKLMDKNIPLTGFLKKLKNRQGMTLLDQEMVDLIVNPTFEKETELKEEIPKPLRLNIYSLFNTNLQVSHWIDIDHFVPKSAHGPGNIIENLVPIGLSLNRYKSNSIPSGLFKVACEIETLKKFCKKEFIKGHPSFLRQSQYNEAFESAREINMYVKEKFPIEKAKEFYKEVMMEHEPGYVKILESFKD